MENKIKRFIELSKEFTIGSKEIYGSTSDFIGVVNGGSTMSSISARDCDYRYPTRLELFTKEQQEKIEKAKRYEEYLTLQSSLFDYYSALERLK